MIPESVSMIPYWQYPFFILHDLLAMTCMTAVLAAARGFRERRRAVTVGCCVVSFVLATLNISLLCPVAARTDEDTAFLLFGSVALISILVLPQIILRSSKHFSSALICLALNVGMEGLFSVFGYLLDETDIFGYHFYEMLFCGAGYALAALFLIYASRNRDLNVVRSTVELIPKWLYVIIILCSFYSYFSVMGRAPELYRFERMSAVLRALSVVGVILFAGYFVFKVFSLMAKQNRILLQMDTQQRNYETMLQSDEQLRLFRHDYRNHMLVVTSLLNAGLMAEAMDYLEKIRDVSGIAERRFTTGNRVVDALLNNKDALAREFEIEMTFSGLAPETGVEPADLCTVVGNLVDNALESVKRFPGERYIAVRSAVRDGVLTFSCVNPVTQKIDIKNNRVKTTKADAAHHGIGLKNVAAVAKKYHGTLLLSCDDERFTADVALRLNDR